jgi:multidrug efflux pump
MKFTDIFIHRPVLASVVSLLIFVLGLRAMVEMEVRQYPETQNTVVTITTAYPGASSELVKGFITTPLQQAIAEAERHRLPDRHQQPGRVGDRGQHAPELRPERGGRGDPGQGREPAQRAAGGGAEPGDRLHHRRLHGADVPGLLQPRHDLPQITDYLIRVVQPQLQALKASPRPS